jgi:hypothetical protein
VNALQVSVSLQILPLDARETLRALPQISDNGIDTQPKRHNLRLKVTLRVCPQTSACGNQVTNQTPNRKVSRMKAREQFALALRIIGVLGIIYLLRTFIRSPQPEVVFLVVRVVCALGGLYLIRGAPLLVKFAYPESTAEPPEKTSA